jgi:hypothetical protein
MTSQFDKSIIKYCKAHPDDQACKLFEEGRRHHRKELEKWRNIGKVLETISEDIEI